MNNWSAHLHRFRLQVRDRILPSCSHIVHIVRLRRSHKPSVVQPELTRQPLFIITRESEIPLADWQAAVDSCSRAQINPNDISWMDVFHPDGKWREAFCWRGDINTFLVRH